MPKHPLVSQKIDQLSVLPGQVLTVWVDDPNNNNKIHQIEIRVTKNGNPEVFIDEGLLYESVHSFGNWTPMDD